MAIEIICKGCARKLRVPDEHAGKQARCPECGTIMPISASALPTVDRVTDLAAPTPVASEELWYMQSADGQTYGPVTRPVLDRWVAEGRVTAQSLLRREDQSSGTPAAQLYPGLSPASSGLTNPFSTPTTTSSNPFADRPAAAGQFFPQSGSTARYRIPHRGGTVLALGIVGVMCCFLAGIAAWVMGWSDLRQMKAGLMDPSGQGLTQAGMIIGMISCALSGLMILFNVVAVLFG